MFKSLLLFTAVAILLSTPTSASALPAQETSAKPAKTGSDAGQAKAKKLYDLDCALCHGATGDGKTDLAKDMQLNLVDWTDPKVLSNFTDQALFDAIRKGKGKMPPEDDSRAKNDEVKNLVQYIRKLAAAQPQQAAPAPAPAPTEAPAAAPAAAPAPSN